MKYEASSKSLTITDLSRSDNNFANIKIPYAYIVGVFVFIYCIIFSQHCYADATINGLTGTMLVPDLEILPKGGARAALHMSGETKFNDASFKGVFAFSDDSEIAVIKRFSFDGKTEQTDPVFAGKYKVRSNMAVAAFIDPNDDYKHSVMLLSGLPGNRVVLGLGANIATNENNKKAMFGRYDEINQEIDPVFFVFGANLNLDPDTKITLDYAGNDFVIGIRHSFDETLSFDFGFYTPDRTHDKSRCVVGANFGF